ncbi:hypothetical protein AB0N81_40715 [Streptomyces sp. NPDC093510]|uniref:hypothetical protein n=1 Tax=Streptomyces sp. NPDC093510 TaxID=3155199 RepID=UPI003420F1E6
MPTITAPVPLPARKTAPYEDWRPPIIGVSVLVPVGADALVVVDLLGGIMIPTGSVHDDQTPQQAAQDVLRGAPKGLPLRRRVALAWVQARRRKVITHVLATEPMTREDIGQLLYIDPRADVRVLPTMRVIDELPTPGRLRVLVGLQARHHRSPAHAEDPQAHPVLAAGRRHDHRRGDGPLDGTRVVGATRWQEERTSTLSPILHQTAARVAASLSRSMTGAATSMAGSAVTALLSDLVGALTTAQH